MRWERFKKYLFRLKKCSFVAFLSHLPQRGRHCAFGTVNNNLSQKKQKRRKNSPSLLLYTVVGAAFSVRMGARVEMACL